MAVETRWFIENRILCHQFSGEITAKDLQKMNQDCDSYLAAVASPIHFLIVVNKVEKVHLTVQELSTLYYDRSTRKVGWVAVVNPRTSTGHHTADLMACALIQMMRLNARRFHSLEDAARFLNDSARAQV